MSLAHIKYKCYSHVSLYLEEHSAHCQTENVRKLAGYTFDLKHLLPENKRLVCHCICSTSIARKWFTSCLTTHSTWKSL